MPSIRLIAGPNGSGKTTLTKILREEHAVPLGQYLNPDDIAKHVNFSALALQLNDQEAVNSAAILAREISVGLRQDWIRDELSFSYESVMSHESHIETVRNAMNQGYKAYLYYVCTSEVNLNMSRVQQRVAEGGHNVPEDKIISRFNRSLSNLREMLEVCYRAYFFDNSKDMTFIAEVTPDKHLDIVADAFQQTQPHWFSENVLEHWDKSMIRQAKV